MGFSRIALLLLPLAGAAQAQAQAQAQAIKNEPPMRQFTDAEREAVQMPVLAFGEDPAFLKDHEKYFYFHRAGTSFDQAYADITECDALSSGSSYYLRADASSVAATTAQYGMLAGSLGGAIGGLMVDAIFGSAERRSQRRINIRNCMFYKDYARYGLQKDLWQAFNFEEGFGKEDPKVREKALLAQAKVASGPKPQQEVLQP